MWNVNNAWDLVQLADNVKNTASQKILSNMSTFNFKIFGTVFVNTRIGEDMSFKIPIFLFPIVYSNFHFYFYLRF